MVELFFAHNILGKTIPRVDHLFALVTRIVEIDIILRRVPRFVRIPRVDPEKKLLLLIILLQPVNRLSDHARAQVIRLEQPPGLVHQIALGACLDLGLSGGQPNIGKAVADPRLAALAADPFNRAKTAVEMIALGHKHRRVEH